MRIFVVCSLLFLCSCSSNYKTANFYKDITAYTINRSQEKTINDIVIDFKKGHFEKEENSKIFRTLGDETVWFNKPIKNNHSKFLTLSLTYITYAKVYLVSNKKIIELHKISSISEFPHKKIFYRHPSWELPDSFIDGDIFIELKNNSGRARLEFYLETQNEFLKRIETEYFFFGTFIIFLLIIASVLLFFSISRKRYSIVFYVLYILCILIEFLAGKGIGVQFLWSDIPFLVTSARSFIQTLAVLSIGMFYTHFYKYPKDANKNKQLFKWSAYATLPFLIVYLYKFFNPSLEYFYLYVWFSMKLIIILFLVNHIFLYKKKLIPNYLVIGFLIPLAIMLISQNINPKTDASWLQIKLISNIYYLALILEILVFTFYIFQTIIDTQNNFVALKKINEELKLNFQKGILETQEEERGKLLADVHDTLGGYLAALRLRLDNEKDPKIIKTLDSFNIEYRYLLNNLYSPKIDANNFIITLKNYLNKMNEISGDIISYNFKIEDISLPKSTCVHLYRSISELITNAIKHSKASSISILLFQKINSELLLKVIDNGVGFNKNRRNLNSFGLQNIEKRIAEINGEMELITNDLGTEVILKIPYGKEN